MSGYRFAPTALLGGTPAAVIMRRWFSILEPPPCEVPHAEDAYSSVGECIST